MNRRHFMRTMFGTAVTLVIQPTIIIPKDYVWDKIRYDLIPVNMNALNFSSVVAAELERVMPHIHTLFERDDVFFDTFKLKRRK